MGGLEVRGISYSIEGVPAETVRAVLGVIREDLHCTAVMLIGPDRHDMAEASRQGPRGRPDVYVRPYLPDARASRLRARLAGVAADAERLRRSHPGRVTLLVGGEFSPAPVGWCPAGGASCA
jgi:hypothetical protein